MEDFAAVLHRLGKEQHSLVTWNQLVDAGVPEDWIRHQIKAGRLLREAPRTYRPWAVRRSWLLRAEGAVLSARAPALVSHRSAAWLYGLDGVSMPGFIDVTVPRHRRPRRRAGVTFHESRLCDLAAPRVLEGIPVTGMARTLLDCFARTPDEATRLALFDDARRRKLVTWDELWGCLLVHTGRGRRGLSAFRRVLVERDGETPPGTVFPRRVALLLEAAGLPAPVFEYPVPGLPYVMDLAWPPPMVGLECLGRIGHDHEGAFEADPVRRNRIGLAGWRLLEVTWRRFVDQPEAVVAEVRQALGGWLSGNGGSRAGGPGAAAGSRR